MTLRAGAHAKLNLTLAIGPRGDDGFHALRSVFVRIGLADELAVGFAADAEHDRLAVDGDFDCPVEGNLVLGAFELVRQAVGRPLPPLAAQLTKRIPVAAGLAGGSSDGAAALELAARAWGVGLAPDVRAEVESALGSDVPFFARGGPAALVEGRGDRVTPLPAVSGNAGILLCVSRHPLLTAAVFARYDELASAPSAADAATGMLLAALEGGLDAADLSNLAASLREANDLWPAAADLDDGIGARREALEDATRRPWLMTGSGPTLLAVYPSPHEAQADGRRLSAVASAALADAILVATDLVGQTTTWRTP